MYCVFACPYKRLFHDDDDDDDASRPDKSLWNAATTLHVHVHVIII